METIKNILNKKWKKIAKTELSKHKLLFFIYYYCFAEFNKNILESEKDVENNFFAWKYGPTLKCMWRKDNFENIPFSSFAQEHELTLKEVNKMQNFIDHITNNLSIWNLVFISHLSKEWMDKNDAGEKMEADKIKKEIRSEEFLNKINTFLKFEKFNIEEIKKEN